MEGGGTLNDQTVTTGDFQQLKTFNLCDGQKVKTIELSLPDKSIPTNIFVKTIRFVDNNN